MDLKRIFKWLGAAFLLSLIITIIVFAIRFHSQPFSDKIADWADFATYISSFLNIILAISNLIVVGIIAMEVRNFDEKKNRENLVMSVKPLANIDNFDGRNNLIVKINNYGLGPVRVLDTTIIDNKGATFKTLYEAIPKTHQHHFVRYYTSRSKDILVGSNNSFALLRIERKINEPSEETLFDVFQNAVRTRLGELKMTITYTDLYESDKFIMETNFAIFRLKR